MRSLSMCIPPCIHPSWMPVTAGPKLQRRSKATGGTSRAKRRTRGTPAEVTGRRMSEAGQAPGGRTNARCTTKRPQCRRPPNFSASMFASPLVRTASSRCGVTTPARRTPRRCGACGRWCNGAVACARAGCRRRLDCRRRLEASAARMAPSAREGPPGERHVHAGGQHQHRAGAGRGGDALLQARQRPQCPHVVYSAEGAVQHRHEQVAADEDERRGDAEELAEGVEADR